MKKINFNKHNSLDHIARILWQQLFDYYFMQRSDLTDLDNLLIDYGDCKKVVGAVFEDDETRVFFWACDMNSSRTIWIDKELPYPKIVNDWTFVVKCEVNKSGATFTVLKG